MCYLELFLLILNHSIKLLFICSKIKIPLVWVAMILWVIMLTSNLNIYHTFSNYDITTVSKGQHSCLLITRLLVLTKRTPVILYTKVTPETLSLTVRCWSAIGNVDQVKSEAMLQLSAAFSAKSIGFE